MTQQPADLVSTLAATEPNKTHRLIDTHIQKQNQSLELETYQYCQGHETKIQSLSVNEEVALEVIGTSAPVLEVIKEEAASEGTCAAPVLEITKEEAASEGTCSAPVLEVTKEEAASEGMCSAPELEVTKEDALSLEVVEALPAEDNGRERLKRHRTEVAGQVWIPDIWGQEEMLKDWIDCSAFDASLVPNGIMSARAALAEEGGRASSGGLSIENRC